MATNTAARPISPDALRQDTQRVLGYLRALGAALPGRVDEALLAFLAAVAECDLTCDLLAQQLSRPER